MASYTYLVNGARGEGYRGIIAGGANAWFGHYFHNSDVLKDGDLLLMDQAPDVSYYTSDIGRMWPVNGKYTAVQRELYRLSSRSQPDGRGVSQPRCLLGSATL